MADHGRRQTMITSPFFRILAQKTAKFILLLTKSQILIQKHSINYIKNGIF